jgi:spermidine synthase
MNTADNAAGARTRLIIIFFFFSGMTGLIYEVLWTRMLINVLGGAPFAVSIILTIFMGGLGLGSYLASRKIDRIQEPLKLVKLYGVLELIIGAYGFMVPVLILFLEPVQSFLYGQLYNYFILYNILTFVFCFILFCIPVICMGATLPILCRFYVTRHDHLGANIGRLYGLNTMGAALGAMLCGFWLINLAGVNGAIVFAVLINAIIGVSCVLWKEKPSKSLLSENKKQETAALYSKPVLIGALLIFAVSGFCSMSYEVIWTRLLGLIVGPTTYSFTIVLVTFIIGLALGSIFFGWISDKTDKPLRLLIFTQFSAAFFVLLVSQLLGNSQLFFAKLLYSFGSRFVLLSFLKALSLFIFMILPTLFLGAAFPLVGKIYTRSIKKIGRSIGVAYSINTIGAVAGSFCAGFLIIPLLGKETGISLIAAFQIVAALGFAFIVFSKMKIRKVIPVVLLAFVGIMLCFYFPQWNHKLLSSGTYHRFSNIKNEINSSGWLESLWQGADILAGNDRREPLFYGEGIGGFTSVLKTSDPLGNVEYSLANSGKADASSRGDMKTQTLLAHFPMLFHPDPKVVFVLGLASGITAGEVLHYPIERLDILEISRQVTAASDFFRPWNNDVLSHPKANLIIQDGRAHLKMSKDKYDVVISEPSNPWMSGLAALFSSDFFKLVRSKLNREGIFVQWLHSYNMNWETFALVGRTFAQVFPESILVTTRPPLTKGADYLLIGFKGKKGLDLKYAHQKLGFIQQSKNITLLYPELLFRLIVSEDLQRLFGSGLIHTDNRPRLEFAAPKLMYLKDESIIKSIQERTWLTPETNKMIQNLRTDVDAQIDFTILALSLYMPFPHMVDLPKAAVLQKERYLKIMIGYCSKNTIDYAYINDAGLKQKCRFIQINTIEENINKMPDKASSYFYLANLYYSAGRLDKAVNNYLNSLNLNTDNAFAQNNLGYALILQEKFRESLSYFKAALRIDPGFSEAHRNLGLALAFLGELEKSVEEYKAAIQTKPGDKTLHNDLGVILSRQSRFEEAVKHFKEALRIDPDFADARKNLDIARSRR